MRKLLTRAETLPYAGSLALLRKERDDADALAKDAIEFAARHVPQHHRGVTTAAREETAVG